MVSWVAQWTHFVHVCIELNQYTVPITYKLYSLEAPFPFITAFSVLYNYYIAPHLSHSIGMLWKLHS